MMSNRTALITGAGRNIGRDVALELARAGHLVVLNGRRREPLQAVADEITNSGGRALISTGDVTNRADVAAIVETVAERFGHVEILINNAVVRSQRAFLDMPDDEWQEVLEVALHGAFHCSQAVLPGMRETGWGRIINFAGVSGQTGVAERAGVSTAKAGLIGLTRALATEFAADGVTVNAVSPGGIGTDRAEWSGHGDPEVVRRYYQRRAEQIPVGRMGTTTEVAALCAYLCSEAAGFVTGQVIGINGGTYMP